MVLELRDKLPKEAFGEVAVASAVSPEEEDVLSALVNLGYQRPAAERALAAVTKSGKPASFDLLFREVLAAMSK